MRIVLDTNVLVSALRNEDGSPALVVDLILAGAIDLIYSADILAEYREVVARPRLQLDPAIASELCDNLAALGEEVDPADFYKGPLSVLMPPPAHFPDPDDALFVAVALAGDADAIVTGNTKHFIKVVRPRVYSPSDFLDLFGDSDPEES
jgi:putative PIN family toxin of toxin-antitoxin system